MKAAPEYICRIEKLVQGGDGLARLPPGEPDGRREVAFVPFTAPGELVRLAPAPRPGNHHAARLLEVLEASPRRVAPGCEYFGRCGGCEWQHLALAAQHEFKRAALLETLERTGGVVWPGEAPLHASPPWGYRNRIRLQRLGGRVGYFERGTRRVLAVTHCPIASPRLNAALAAAPAAPGGSGEIELAADNADGGWTGAQSPLTYRVGEFSYRVSPGSFFQVNRFLAAELVAAVVEGEAGASALDLYSGVGLFALPLARRFARVTAVEANAAAVADLRVNAASIPHLAVVAGTAGRHVAAAGGAVPDLVVADPPRAGLGPSLAAALAALGPPRLTLVACDAATLGRDLKTLLAAGYRIAGLELFDLFPQTHRLETVVKLHRN